MKRYLVFGGPNYYPSGGWDDFIKDCDTVEEAKAADRDRKCEWKQVGGGSGIVWVYIASFDAWTTSAKSPVLK